MAKSIVSQVEALQAKVGTATEDAQKVDEGQKAAATRVRKVLGEVAKDCKALRAAVLDAKNAKPAKKSKK